MQRGYGIASQISLLFLQHVRKMRGQLHDRGKFPNGRHVDAKSERALDAVPEFERAERIQPYGSQRNIVRDLVSIYSEDKADLMAQVCFNRGAAAGRRCKRSHRLLKLWRNRGGNGQGRLANFAKERIVSGSGGEFAPPLELERHDDRVRFTANKTFL